MLGCYLEDYMSCSKLGCYLAVGSSSTYLAWVSICELPVLVLIAVLGLDCYNRWESASGSRLGCYPEASILL